MDNWTRLYSSIFFILPRIFPHWSVPPFRCGLTFFFLYWVLTLFFRYKLVDRYISFCSATVSSHGKSSVNLGSIRNGIRAVGECVSRVASRRHNRLVHLADFAVERASPLTLPFRQPPCRISNRYDLRSSDLPFRPPKIRHYSRSHVGRVSA